jgi:hypothetical protein
MSDETTTVPEAKPAKRLAPRKPVSKPDAKKARPAVKKADPGKPETRKAPPAKSADAKKAPAPAKAAKKAPAAKKTAPAKTATKAAAKKAPAKKSAPAKKVAPAKKAAAATTEKKERKPNARHGMPPNWMELDKHGFLKGGDSSFIFAEMLKGGETRADVVTRIRETLPNMTTANGREKNIPSLMATLLQKAKRDGYAVKATWKLVPPTAASGSKKIAAASKSKVTKTASTSPAKRPAKRSAKS